jgi:Uncharacterized protein conserved in bacteria
MERRIEEFILEHHLLTFSSGSNGQVWCASAFYTYNSAEKQFIITSEEKTKHIQLALPSMEVAGNIALETEKIGIIRGLQFSAKLIKGGLKEKLLYLKRFPYAVLKGGDLWILEITEAKFTDNRLGFGKKLYWRRGDETAETSI